MVELEIRDLSIQGDGIADGPDGPVYVPFALPGERIAGTPDGNRIAAPRILRPSDDRVKAPCPHFKTCGGCSLQHASDGFLAGWKTGVVRRALQAQDLTAEFAPPLVSPPSARRRATFAGRRTKKGVQVGFHARASDTVVEIPSCTLLHPDILATIPALQALTRLGATRTKRVTIAVTQSVEGPDVAMDGAIVPDGALLATLGQLVERFRLARLKWNDEVIAVRAAPVQRIGPAHVLPPPGAFLQATEAGQAALTQAVVTAMDGAKTVVDLFAGCGTFSLPLAQTADVRAIESDAALLDALDSGWRKTRGLHLVTVEKRDLFRNPVLPGDFKGIDGVVIDPPRAGARAQIAALAESDVATIVYVSCNPVTFARDARVLVAAGYRIGTVQVVDQFRWSAHVELVVRFDR